MDERERLAAELHEHAGALGADSLRFLIDQARTLLRNEEIDRINRGIDEANAAAAADRKARAGKKKAKEPSAARRALEIEGSADGKTFHLVVGGKYKSFDAAEVSALVRLSHGFKADADAKRALYAWFRRERGDALSDFGIADAAEPLLLELARLFRSRFKAPAASRRLRR